MLALPRVDVLALGEGKYELDMEDACDVGTLRLPLRELFGEPTARGSNRCSSVPKSRTLGESTCSDLLSERARDFDATEEGRRNILMIVVKNKKVEAVEKMM